ncbi:MAG TPA: ABC transporter permease [Actinomycetes bacterium]
MSTSELTRPATYGLLDRPAPVSTRLLRSELRLVFRRRRNLAILGVLACAPLLLGIAIKIGGGGDGGGGGPAFIGQITRNGLFLAFTSLVVTLPLFLPLAVSVVSGESVAGEASAGTLRSLLVVPVGRTRLLLVKYAGIVAFGLAAATVVGAMGVLVGLLLFPTGPVTLLSGSTISFGAALMRVLLVVLYVAAMLAGIAAIGLFISTLTEVPLAAMAATAITVVVVAILDSVPQISSIHPYLFVQWWFSFGDLIRDPVVYGPMVHGLVVHAVYVAVFGSLAWARLTTKDVSG